MVGISCRLSYLILFVVVVVVVVRPKLFSPYLSKINQREKQRGW